MDPPTAVVELEPEPKPENMEEAKEIGPMLSCNLYDTELCHKIAQVFLPGLATACVDNTSGDLFRSPATVAVDLRKEMVEYLTQRSESFVAVSVVLEGGPEAEASDHPLDVISDFVDDFASVKRNLFSRVSGWLLSEKREDKIDDFVQEMEINGFWLIDRRQAIAQTVLKNVDFMNNFHCDMKFNSEEELAGHVLLCKFRTMNCTNEGCSAIFCASHLQQHDLACPFKIIPCEQNCSENLMRREMDRHCITVCPMKLVNCPFYPVGCTIPVPQYSIHQHCTENLQTHLLHILQLIYHEASEEDLKKRARQLEEASSPEQLVNARDARSLTFAVKELEATLGPLEITIKKETNENSAEPSNLEANAQNEAGQS
ncbi:Zinc finger, TRAF-type [Dillenia turbinata]|uniref:Zinc finger, TRAF-type n=1 Tax=Dillenia turbinata TaxID=194707 RepID=A0AAN8ZFJ1_9MAGN